MPKELRIGDTVEGGSVLAGIDPLTHKVLYVSPKDEYDLFFLSEAQQHVRDLNLRSRGIRFRLPTDSELTVLFNNRILIGQFENSFYLSSTVTDGMIHYRNFNGGNIFVDIPSQPMAVRLLQYSLK